MKTFLQTALSSPFFSLSQNQKEQLLLPALKDLTEHHRCSCEAYGRIIEILSPRLDQANSLADLPYLPISLFKHRRLRSVPDEDIYTTLHSSGTSGGPVSHVDLDRADARQASVALSSVLTIFMQGKRLPMLIIDCPSTLLKHNTLGARASAILGLMPHGRDHCFALNDDLTLAKDRVFEYLAKHASEPLLLYGFTSIIWRHFLPSAVSQRFNLANSLLFHSGGWKKLKEQSVSSEAFNARLKNDLNIGRVINFYGMAETPGLIFPENSDGLLYTPAFADIIIRDLKTFEPLPDGREGLIQILNLLPRSYPGHALLTEDMGVIEKTDSGVSGFMGKAFRVIGRAPQAILRGCSDVLSDRGDA